MSSVYINLNGTYLRTRYPFKPLNPILQYAKIPYGFYVDSTALCPLRGVQRKMSLKAFALYILIIIVFFTPLLLSGSDNYLFQRIGAVILVVDPEHAADVLTRWIEDTGGYYLHRSEERVTLRIPYQEIGSLRVYMESIAEEVIKF